MMLILQMVFGFKDEKHFFAGLHKMFSPAFEKK